MESNIARKSERRELVRVRIPPHKSIVFLKCMPSCIPNSSEEKCHFLYWTNSLINTSS
jgi:hypothetical protein